MPRARIHARLPVIVSISPLCATVPNGCTSRQLGEVLVEKRWWNTAKRDEHSGSRKSAKYAPSSLDDKSPL